MIHHRRLMQENFSQSKVNGNLQQYFARALETTLKYMWSHKADVRHIGGFVEKTFLFNQSCQFASIVHQKVTVFEEAPESIAVTAANVRSALETTKCKMRSTKV